MLPLVMLGGAAAAQAPLLEWQEQVIPGVCTLRIAVPNGWTASMRSALAGAVDIRITPESGPRAEVLITGLAQQGGSELKKTGDIKRATKAMGEQLLSGSAEHRIELERVDGTAGSGFFYSLTDKRPQLPEDQYRYMTQGIMAVGPLRLAVTVLADQPASPAKRMALDLLRTAGCTAESTGSRKSLPENRPR
jgi:hypothetical protein